MPQKAKPQKVKSQPKAKAVKPVVFKKGDSVSFFVSHGKVQKVGTVVGVVQPGVFPDIDAKAYKGLKKSGYNNAKSREEKSYLVESDGSLFWPKSVEKF